MISGTYFVSAAILRRARRCCCAGDSLGTWGYMAIAVRGVLLRIGGRRSAYLTVSEMFPLETRAMAIALFYAISHRHRRAVGPLPFGQLLAAATRPGRHRLPDRAGAMALAARRDRLGVAPSSSRWRTSPSR